MPMLRVLRAGRRTWKTIFGIEDKLSEIYIFKVLQLVYKQGSISE